MPLKHPRLCNCGNVIGGGSHDLGKGDACELCEVVPTRGREGKDAYMLMQGDVSQNLRDGYLLLDDDEPADVEDNH